VPIDLAGSADQQSPEPASLTLEDQDHFARNRSTNVHYSEGPTLTALDSLPMGTRAGQLDPGVVLHLMNEKAMGVDAIERCD
jgi:Acetokinase family